MLTIRQRSLWSGFHFEVVDPANAVLAELLWPTFAQARNARLKWHKPGSPEGDLRIRTPQGDYRIGFEFLTRAFANDVRFLLQQGDELLAVADVLFPKEGFKRHEIFLRQPFDGQLVRDNRWGRVRYRVRTGTQKVGTIEEPRWFSIRRELRMDLPADMPLPQQTFLAFLTLNSAFR